jgi:transcriptional regulator of arginine metabolism
MELQTREERLRAIQEILRSQEVRSQERVVSLLARRGFAVTQSSVSRDLRDLGVAKVAGRYEFPASSAPRTRERFESLLGDGLRYCTPAGPNLLVLHTVVGGASRLALALDQSGWSEILGTLAGDDTIFVATSNAREQKALRLRLEPWEREPHP